jgi:hypothetical protein
MSNECNANENKHSEYIDVYSRQDAIADGILVDLMQPSLVSLVKQAGFRYPIAMTKTAFSRYVEFDLLADNYYGQDLIGRLWDVLCMLSVQIKPNRNKSEIYFVFTCLPNQHQAIDYQYDDFLEIDAGDDFPSSFKLCKLKAVCGAGDNGEPCITIMLPSED